MMDSFYDFIQNNPSSIRLSVNELLLAEYQCPLSETRYDIWSHHNYYIYVISGQKKWFTHNQEILLQKGDCLFIRKGAHSVNQYFEEGFCALVLFVPDEFIRSILLENRIELKDTKCFTDRDSLFAIKPDKLMAAYFQSFLSYLSKKDKPEDKLLELKFKELVMLTASQKYNKDLNGYFSSLCKTGNPSLLELMEDNFYYPMSLEEYARLAGRSLSAFKSDFKKLFGTTPGRWLKKKRLSYSQYLLKHTDKLVTEIVFDSGFQNTSHFIREFKTEFGCTPLVYRKKTS